MHGNASFSEIQVSGLERLNLLPTGFAQYAVIVSAQALKFFTTHLSSEEHADEAIRVAMDAVASTWVLWDINSCPVPPDCDARRVRPFIKQYLDDFGYSGSFTITATGLLTDVPRDVLRALSSTGIDFHHILISSHLLMFLAFFN